MAEHGERGRPRLPLACRPQGRTAPQGEPSGGHRKGSPAVHEIAARGFRSADAYERARPEYPRAAADALVGALSLGAGTIVVDLGAGTGKLTRALAGTGARLVAVEPLVGMRAELARAVPGVAVVGGVAEAIPLRGGAAGAVVAAQAFHWFSSDGALVEIHRVLGPGGGLGLVWNELVWSVPWVAELGAILDPLTGSVPRFRTGRVAARPEPVEVPYETRVHWCRAQR